MIDTICKVNTVNIPLSHAEMRVEKVTTVGFISSFFICSNMCIALDGFIPLVLNIRAKMKKKKKTMPFEER